MNSLVALVRNYILEQDVAYQAYRAKLITAAMAANNDLPPNYDRFNDMHSPCHGYDWDGRTYGKGQYLHIPPEWREHDARPSNFKPIFKHNFKLKSTLEEAQQMLDLNGRYADVSHGKTWEADGIKTCYVYIKTNRSGLNELLQDYKKEQQDIDNLAKKEQKQQQVLENLTKKAVAPVGKVVVKGQVKVIKEQDSMYGLTIKMLVELDDKSTVWGTVPSSILDDLKQGNKIQFSASFEQSKDDVTHAFFKRPTKAVILEASN